MRLTRFVHYLLVPAPSFVKVLAYRHLFGYRVGKGVKIGLSLICADKCSIGARTRIGHLNYISHMKNLSIGCDAIIGHANIILGGDAVDIGDEATVARFNEINSILNPLTSNPADPRLFIGKGAVITAWHKIDFSDRVEIGESAIIAGRHTNLWTHNRQGVRPVKVGRNCYVGSGVQMVPGSSIGSYCVVGLGSVITKPLEKDWYLVAGVPAREIKPLDEESRVLVEFPTRPDLAGRQGEGG